MATGTIKAIVEDRGFGFIEQSNGDDDIFFHANQLLYPLEFGPQLTRLDVTYDIERDSRSGKMRAHNIRAAR